MHDSLSRHTKVRCYREVSLLGKFVIAEYTVCEFGTFATMH